MKFIFVIVLVATLTACAKTELPPVTVGGPQFDMTRFACGTRPVPPDPASVANKGGSAAARYEQGLRTWGQRCWNALGSVGHELQAAGQVVTAPKASK